MKLQNVLLLGAGAVGIYELFQLNQAKDNINLVFQGVQPQGLLKYNLQFTVQNPSNISITLSSLSANVTANGYNLGNVSFFPGQPLQIAPNAQAALNLTLQPNILSLAADAYSFLNSIPDELAFSLNGSMNINGIVIPIVNVGKTVNLN